MTPNPNTLKFALEDRFLVADPEISVVFDRTSLSDCAQIPLIIEKIFSFPYIEQIFIHQNYLALSKNTAVEWFEVQNELKFFLKEYLENHQFIFTEHPNFSSQKNYFPTSEYDGIIREIIESQVQPAVAQDGGKIRFAGYENGVVYVFMEGACKGCPSAPLTLKGGIERLLQQILPDIVNKVSAFKIPLTEKI